MNVDWLLPDWPVPAGVKAVCTTRVGGMSSGPYASLNLGDHVGDDPSHVAANRGVLASSIAARPVFLKQVHGTHLEAIDEETPDGTEADACISASPNVACTIMVADCLPLLLCTADGAMVGAVHVGWRGLANGVVESAVARLLADAAIPASQVLAWLGPCIGPDAFEVGEDVKAALDTTEESKIAFKAGLPGKWLADLPALTRQRLRGLGIERIHGNDGSTPWCTVSNPSRFFSHRRDRVSGRFAAAIWRA